MKQIYTNATERVYLKIYKDGALYAATSDPTFSISVVGSTAAPRTGTAVAESTGVYFFTTDISETLSQGVLKVAWDYIVDAVPGTKVEYISVVTPYVDFMDIKNMFPLESDEEIENAEVFSRFMINSYTGSDFGLTAKTINLFGNNQKVLVLPERLERLDSIAVNDEVLWTRTPAVNELGRIITITDTNQGLLSEKADEVPIWSDFNEFGLWKKSYKYTITGLWGWANVPDEVEYAAKLLADDYFCKETGWKKRFVQQINASDWRIVFNTRQFTGTGNFFVDQILQGYRAHGWMLI